MLALDHKLITSAAMAFNRAVAEGMEDSTPLGRLMVQKITHEDGQYLAQYRPVELQMLSEQEKEKLWSHVKDESPLITRNGFFTTLAADAAQKRANLFAKIACRAEGGRELASALVFDELKTEPYKKYLGIIMPDFAKLL